MKFLYPRWDSNPQRHKHLILSQACLPISPLGYRSFELMRRVRDSNSHIPCENGGFQDRCCTN